MQKRQTVMTSVRITQSFVIASPGVKNEYITTMFFYSTFPMQISSFSVTKLRQRFAIWKRRVAEVLLLKLGARVLNHARNRTKYYRNQLSPNRAHSHLLRASHSTQTPFPTNNALKTTNFRSLTQLTFPT